MRLEFARQWLYQRLTKTRRTPRFAEAALAQLVEHVIRNDGVTCSSHVSGTSLTDCHFTFFFRTRAFRGMSAPGRERRKL